MCADVIPGHPVCCLYFLLKEPVRDEVTQSFEEMLVAVSNQREWVIQCPELVDYIEEYSADEGADRVVHTYGTVLRMFSALPPWGEKLPREVDVKHFEEVSLVVSEVCRLSQEMGCEFAVQLDDALIGEIKGGEPDESVRRGLLEEWKKGLGL